MPASVVQRPGSRSRSRTARAAMRGATTRARFGRRAPNGDAARGRARGRARFGSPSRRAASVTAAVAGRPRSRSSAVMHAQVILELVEVALGERRPRRAAAAGSARCAARCRRSVHSCGSPGAGEGRVHDVPLPALFGERAAAVGAQPVILALATGVAALLVRLDEARRPPCGGAPGTACPRTTRARRPTGRAPPG